MISTIITTKNGSRYICRAIDSVLAQIPALKALSPSCDLELIIISDGSSDNTAEIVRKKIAQAIEFGQANDGQIRLIELRQNIGPGLARNLAILGGDAEGQNYPEARGQYIALLDDDDVWTDPKKLANQKVFLDIDENVVLVGASRVEFIAEDFIKENNIAINDAANTVTNTAHKYFYGEKDATKIRKNMLLKNPVITSSVMFRTYIFKGLGGFENMYLAEDYDLWLRMGLAGQILNIDGADTSYTVRKGSASNARKLELNKAVLNLVKKYKGLYPNYFLAILKAHARIALFHLKKFF